MKKTPHEVFGWKKPEKTPEEMELEGKSVEELEDQANKDMDWPAEVRNSESIDDLIHNLEWAKDFNGQKGEALMRKIKAAEDFLQKNMELIVEGVLNTTEKAEAGAKYIEGSNEDLRNNLGELVSALGDSELEILTRKLMKKEMAAYFKENKMALAEAAIENAPSAASVFEVVKRFKQIKDGEKIYSRKELEDIMADNLRFELELFFYVEAHNTDKTAVDSSIIHNLREQIVKHAGKLPLAMNIREETAGRFNSKIDQIVEAKVEKFVKTVSSSDDREVPKKGGFFASLKTGFGLWGKKK